jgi:hypothetical protein
VAFPWNESIATGGFIYYVGQYKRYESGYLKWDMGRNLKINFQHAVMGNGFH